MQWTEEQEAIFRWFRTGRGNLLVDAKAGSGKSTTIREGVVWAPEPSVLICAFNKHIADEMNEALNQVKGRVIKSATLHSVGYEIIKQNWPKTPLREHRTEELARAVFDKAKVKKRFSLIKAVVDTCAKVKNALPEAETVEDILMIGEDFDTFAAEKMMAWDDQAHLILATLEASKQNTGSIGYDDMIWLPVTHKWKPKGRFRLVVIDETQDMNAAQLTLAQMMVAEPFGRLMFVGDENQAVYGWRGADRFSMTRIRREVECKELPLNVSFRCSKAVIREAQTIVPSITPLPNAPVGRVHHISFPEIGLYAQPGDFVLSRFNAPLVSACIAIRRMGLKAHIDGREALSQARNILGKIERTGTSLISFERDVANWMQKEIAIARSRSSPARSQRATDFGMLLGRLAREASSMAEIREILDALFKGRRSPNAIVCSTIHRSKGREAPRVFVLKDTLPLRQASPEYEYDMHEEKNLEYIAITRAKVDLFWVSGLPEQQRPVLADPFDDQKAEDKRLRDELNIKPSKVGLSAEEEEALSMDEDW
jgi:superfamily I DNA/RNA helicase